MLVLPPTTPHPTLSMPELQAQLLREGWPAIRANREHLPRISAAEARAEDKRSWRAGEILFGLVNNDHEDYHYLIF